MPCKTTPSIHHGFALLVTVKEVAVEGSRLASLSPTARFFDLAKKGSKLFSALRASKRNWKILDNGVAYQADESCDNTAKAVGFYMKATDSVWVAHDYVEFSEKITS